MPRRSLRLALLSAALAVPAIGGISGLLPASGAVAGKIEDRLPAVAASGAETPALRLALGPDPMAPPPPPPGHREGPEVPPPPGVPPLARNLAAAETVVGIRANQIDAWRDFADARVEAAGKAATRLAQAADALKTRLSPDQLERLARLEPSLLPPPPGPPGAGPNRLPPR